MSIKLPNKGKISQPNNSDLFGNIWYTKNMDFDEAGYIKLSSRTARIYSEEDGGSFDIPTAFGRFGDGLFHIVSADRAFDTNLNRNVSTIVAQDVTANSPQLDFDSFGRWWQNRWHAVNNASPGKLFYTNGTAWTDTGVSLTQGKAHPLEVFRDKNAICIGNANTVLLVDNSYATLVTLSLPTDYEVQGLSYSNDKIAIVANLSDTIAGQNQEAFLFIWDGSANGASSSTAVPNAGFPVGSDTIMAIAPYKTSWVILTRNGKLLYFNGGGFQELAAFPFWYIKATWSGSGNRSMYGDGIIADGDLIYINISGNLVPFGVKDEVFLENNPSGIWCYDPSVGLYHTYAPSVSKVSVLRVANTDIDLTSDIFTATAGTIPATGNPVKYTYNRSTLIAGLTINVVYYIIRHNATMFSLALTKADALAGNKVNITSTGDSINYFFSLDVVDYGAALASTSGRTGAIGFMGKTESIYDDVIFGGDYNDITSATTDYATLNISIPSFDNIGYFTTPKYISRQIEDVNQKVFIKYRPLSNTDSITIKMKDSEIYGIPVSTPQKNSIRCQWTNSTTFTTTADLSEVYTYLTDASKECECEIISGAGAGQMSQISSILFSGGTYTVTLQDTLEGVTATYYCDILINNWKYLGQITASDMKGWKEFPIATSSKWVKFKTILRGVGTTIEEQTFISKAQLQAS